MAAIARANSDPEAYDAEAARGRAMPLQAAIEMAIRELEHAAQSVGLGRGVSPEMP